ncbi:MAG: DUF1801 domain-containing protein [Bacteroidota bacterium]
MNPEIKKYNDSQADAEIDICYQLASIIDELMPEAESKIWHRHPVWFLEGNPIVGYNKLKAGIRLMFWSGASFVEEQLKLGTDKFKDASMIYNNPEQIIPEDIERWIGKSKEIQWDYKNIYKRKGKLERLK